MTRQEMLERLHARGVRFEVEQDVVGWDGTAVRVRGHDALATERTISPVDLLAISAGSEPANELSVQIQGDIREIYTIGDANRPRTVYEATLQGASVAGTL